MMNAPLDETHAMNETEPLLAKYVDGLTEKEKQAYRIAKSHLGSSFSLAKSLGYLEWKAAQSSS